MSLKSPIILPLGSSPSIGFYLSLSSQSTNVALKSFFPPKPTKSNMDENLHQPYLKTRQSTPISQLSHFIQKEICLRQDFTAESLIKVTALVK